MPMISSLYRPVLGVLRHRRGAVMMMFAMALPVLIFAIGMGIDYARAMKAQTRMNAVADSAALSAVSKVGMGMKDADAVAYARKIFDAQALPLIQSGDIVMGDVTINAPTDNKGRRNATVVYRAVSNNVFARILGLNTLAIAGQSQTTNAIAPDIDFYMLLDVSSSMALPTTTAGLNTIARNNPEGCKFACHVKYYNYYGRGAQGQRTDYYGVAKSFKLTLRIDEEGAAISTLADTARAASSKTGAKYRMAIATFRGKGGFELKVKMTDQLSDAVDATKNLAPIEYYQFGCPTRNCRSTEVGYNNLDSGTSDAMDQINKVIVPPGLGINGQTAQGVLFIVTDGMRNENIPDNPEVEIDTSKCDVIKARGIRIAILYTEYLKETLDNFPWGQRKIAPYLYKVEPALQRCSSPGLYTKVKTDDDITEAMDRLFQSALATVRITG